MSYPQYPSGPQQPPYGGPPGGQPPYDPTGGQPPYGGAPGGQPPYGMPPGTPGDQPPYGQPPYDPTGGQPSYGMPPGPPGGQPPYGPPGDQPPYGQPPYGPPPKKGMSTGAKVGIGIGGCLGLLAIMIVVIAIVVSLSSGGDTETTSPTPSSSEEESAQESGDEAEEEDVAEQEGVVMTATSAGTAGDVLDDTVYTVLDVEITNNTDEALNINPLYFTAVLDDGTEKNDWGEALFADIQQFEVQQLQPGSTASGQVAVVGEVVVDEIWYDPSFGMGDPTIALVD